jgi:hypothetical protein
MTKVSILYLDRIRDDRWVSNELPDFLKDSNLHNNRDDLFVYKGPAIL